MDKVTAIYTRLSVVETEPDGTPRLAGLITQEEDCRRYAAFKQWGNIEIYQEQGKSGYNDVNRPEFNRLVKDIDAGRVGAVLFWKIDRCYRRTLKLLKFHKKCVAAGVHFVATTQGIDTSIPGTGTLLLTILAAIAEAESEIRSHRLKGHRERMRAAGRERSGGWRQFGYEADNITRRPKEVRLIRKSADMIIGGASLRSVWAVWDKAGMRNGRGRPVASQTIRRALLSGRHLDKTTAALVQSILADPRRRTNAAGANRRVYLLGGLVRCGECGVVLRGRPKGLLRFYYCRTGEAGGCGKVSVRADYAEARVAEAVYLSGAMELESPSADMGLSGAEDRLRESLRGSQARLEGLVPAYVSGDMTAREVRLARERLESNIDRDRTALAALAAPRLRAETWRELVERAPKSFDVSDPVEFDRWRRLIEAVFAEIVVEKHPGGPEFASERVRLILRDTYIEIMHREVG